MAYLLKGAPAGKAIAQQLEERIEKLASKGIVPAAAIVRLGENPDDISYEKSVVKKFEKHGLKTVLVTMPSDTKEEELIAKLTEINDDEKINGVLMMRPLPKGLDEKRICDTLLAAKDADGITSKSMAGLYAGDENVFAPCTAEACLELLKFNNIELKGKNVVVLGRSLVIGKPVSMMLMKENATVTICHSKTKNIEEICKNADIIISAIGRAKYLNKSFTSSNQVIIDVGINYDENNKLCGDVDFENVEGCVNAVSPVPGGVGSVTTSVLMRHIVISCERMNCQNKG